MSWIGGITLKPKFIRKDLNGNELGTIQFPLLSEDGMLYSPDRYIITKRNLAGSLSQSLIGYRHNFKLHLNKFIRAEVLYNEFTQLLEWMDDTINSKVYFYPNEGTENYDSLLMNDKFELKLIWEGIYTKVYEGLVLDISSRNLTPKINTNWGQLIDPNAISVLNYETGEPIIAN